MKCLLCDKYNLNMKIQKNLQPIPMNEIFNLLEQKRPRRDAKTVLSNGSRMRPGAWGDIILEEIFEQATQIRTPPTTNPNPKTFTKPKT